MSHNKERKEKFCLNCNAHIYGRYCHICGQENIEAKQSFWHLVTHFVYDVTHFDGKFFSTLKYLLFKPGFLSHEYLRGRRASYLDPVRMYVFTSAIFFLIFFSFVHTTKNLITDTNTAATNVLIQDKKNLQNQLAAIKDSTEKKKLAQTIDSLENVITDVKSDSSGISQTSDTSADSGGPKTRLYLDDTLLPSTVEKYDSIQNALPADKKDGWFTRVFKRRGIVLTQEYHRDKKNFYENLTDKFFHSFPEMMFISLPLAALILELLYIRRRKKFYFVNHGVFTIHLYIAFYIFLLLYYLFSGLHHVSGWHIFNWLQTFTILSMFFYMYKAMHNFYEQGRIKTIFKMLIFDFLYLFVLVFLVAVFFISSLFQV